MQGAELFILSIVAHCYLLSLALLIVSTICRSASGSGRHGGLLTWHQYQLSNISLGIDTDVKRHHVETIVSTLRTAVLYSQGRFMD